MLLSHEQLFILTMDDLRRRVSSGTDYDFIRACGLCRHLILDGGSSLFHMANKTKRVELIFTVADIPEWTKIRMATSWVTIDPANGLTDKTIRLTEEKFLSHKLLWLGRYEFSVQDVIKYVSHLMGGVHSGPATSPHKRAFLAFQKTILGENPPPIIIYAIRAICVVIIKAMEGLEELIR